MHRILTCVLLTAGAVLAQQPRFHRWIAADAELVLFFDLNAAGDGIGQRWLRGAKRLRVDSFDNVAGWARRLDAGVARQVRSITAYTLPAEDAEAVVVVELSGPPDELFAWLQDGDGYWKKTIDGATVHSFKAEGRRVYTLAAPPADGGHAVVFCRDLDQLSAAAGVIKGDKPALAGSDNPIAARRCPPGTYLRLITTNSRRLTKAGPTSTLFKQSSGFALTAGEHDGVFRAELTVQGKSPDAAANIAAMANGLIALAQLIAGGEKTAPDVRQDRLALLRALSVKPHDAEVLVRFELPSAKLAALLDRNEARSKRDEKDAAPGAKKRDR